METEFKSQIKSGRNWVAFFLPQPKTVVMVEGFVVGPFDTAQNALAWAYEHAPNGIFSLKELINPGLEI